MKKFKHKLSLLFLYIISCNIKCNYINEYRGSTILEIKKVSWKIYKFIVRYPRHGHYVIYIKYDIAKFFKVGDTI